MTAPKLFRVKGMHCASCAATIEKTLRKAEGVKAAEVNYGSETAKVTFDESKTNHHHLSKLIEPLGYTLADQEDHAEHTGAHQTKKEKLADLTALRKKVLAIMPLACISIALMAWDGFSAIKLLPAINEVTKVFFHHLLPLFATYSLFVVGQPYLAGVYRFMRYGKANMDSLIGIGTLTAFLYSFAVSAFEDILRPFLNVEYTYYDITIVVIAFITLGKYLEARSKLKTGDAIEKLLTLQAKTALVLKDGREMEIPIAEVAHGDIIIVKPGAKIPVDGMVQSGETFIDEALVTGEPMPVKKTTHDMVVGGTINTTGSITFSATKVGSETLLAQIIKMVEEAQSSKAPIQAMADKISAVFVPVVVVLAVLDLGVWLLFGPQYFGFSQALTYGLTSFVGILVIACPCALGLATPTAIIVGVGKGAREGILIKDAATLEKLHHIDTVVVDKTGTITQGKPGLLSIESFDGQSKEDVIHLLASLEASSEHPIAQAILAYARERHIPTSPMSKFSAIKGKGVRGTIQEIEYFAGNVTLAAEFGLAIDAAALAKETKEGKTPILLFTSRKVLGLILIADALKPEAREAVATLHRLGLKVVMLTGDDKNTARFIADQAGIDEVVAEVLPADKLKAVKTLQAKGKKVVMAGDGVNDAPALAQADVGIAMSTGTDVAIESAGITLLHGDLSKLAKAIRLSKLTMRGIKQNLFWAFVYNIVGIPLAGGVFYPLFGWLLNPIFAGLAMAFSSVSVISNSLRLKVKKL